MHKPAVEITEKSKTLCRSLLLTENNVSKDSLFHNDSFENICEMIRNRNEAKVIQDISRLIVPSAQTLVTCGVKRLKYLIECQ